MATNEVNRNDYEADAVNAAKSAMLELFHALGEYREQIMLIGGWVPDLLFPNASPRHVGSMDIDLALDHRKFDEEGYRTVAQSLKQRGYVQDSKQPFIYRKKITDKITVQLDLLAGEYGGTAKKRRTQKVQDVQPRKVRGCDFAFESYVEVTLQGTLPNGAVDSTKIRIASAVAIIVMKGITMADRIKSKDAYDVYFCVKNFHGGIEALAGEFQPHLKHGLVKDGLTNLSDKFQTEKNYGPVSVADFENLPHGDERDEMIRDAFEQIRALLTILGYGAGGTK